MKGLRKYLAPFAPDISGASSVLYEMGGILVICDAGGCTGNVCGFDEPRWFAKKSCIFSAGLRDMDAIFGRDEKLAEKLGKAADQMKPSFAGMIGTPVPAVIGTDYRALRRMVQARTGLPVLAIETTGLKQYDTGEELAYGELFGAFAVENYPVEPGRIGVIGATPLDTSDLHIKEKLERKFPGRHIICYGMGDGLACVREASMAEYNLVISPSGIGAAKDLKKRFGTPYRVDYPVADELLPGDLYDRKEGAFRKVLIIHQQVIANAIREELKARMGGDTEIRAASFFMMEQEYMQEGDVRLAGEEDVLKLANQGYTVVIGDPILQPMFPKDILFVKVPHFACSGKLYDEE